MYRTMVLVWTEALDRAQYIVSDISLSNFLFTQVVSALDGLSF